MMIGMRIQREDSLALMMLAQKIHDLTLKACTAPSVSIMLKIPE
jgi:hypothetical protein